MPEIKSFAPDNITLIHINKPSLTKARNIGLQEAIKTNAEVIIYIDDDVEISKDFISNHITTYDDNTIQAVGGRERLSQKLTWKKSFINRLFKLFLALSKKSNRYGKNRIAPGLMICKTLFLCDSRDAHHSCYLDTVRGCNMSFRTTALKKLNGFDENFIGSARREETDVCIRLRESYGEDSILYVPEASLFHNMANTGGCRVTGKAFEDHKRNEFYFVHKHIHNPWLRCAAKAFISIKLHILET